MSRPNDRVQEAADVLFICTGNYYRSRLAELLFNHYVALNKLSWHAESRGLIHDPSLPGIAPEAAEFLALRGVNLTDEANRPPQLVTLAEFESAHLVIGLCAAEHAPMMHRRFGVLATDRENDGSLRYWHVDDVPARVPLMARLFIPNENQAAQRPQSSGEHIDFAVRLLIYELVGIAEPEVPQFPSPAKLPDTKAPGIDTSRSSSHHGPR